MRSPRDRFLLAGVGMLLALLPCASSASISKGIVRVAIFDDGRAHARPAWPADPATTVRTWPFCPTDRIPCRPETLAWIHLELSLDVYSLRRNAPHATIDEILDGTTEDLVPLVTALADYFENAGVESEVSRVAFVQGLVKAVQYRFDQESGWTEYPKYGIEFLVDEQGDCDDAAITLTILLRDLGYQAYFVGWVGPESGHMSTAIVPDRGDLLTFEPPTGSRWIEWPELPRMIHVDGTGVPSGCGSAWTNCSPIGFNQWSEEELEILRVVSAEATNLTEEYPLSAWKNGGLERPNRVVVDRRSVSSEEIFEEALARDSRSHHLILEERLVLLGLDREQARTYVPRSRSQQLFWPILIFSTGVLVVFSALAWVEYKERLKKYQQTLELRKQKKF